MRISKLLLFLAIFLALVSASEGGIGALFGFFAKWFGTVVVKTGVKAGGAIAKGAVKTGKGITKLTTGIKTFGAGTGRLAAQTGGKIAVVTQKTFRGAKDILVRNYRRIGGNTFKRLRDPLIINPRRGAAYNKFLFMASTVKEALKSPSFYMKVGK